MLHAPFLYNHLIGIRGLHIFINMLSTSQGLMLRGGFYSSVLISLIMLFRYRAIVDKAFHSMLEWVVSQKRFRTS